MFPKHRCLHGPWTLPTQFCFWKNKLPAFASTLLQQAPHRVTATGWLPLADAAEKCCHCLNSWVKNSWRFLFVVAIALFTAASYYLVRDDESNGNSFSLSIRAWVNVWDRYFLQHTLSTLQLTCSGGSWTTLGSNRRTAALLSQPISLASLILWCTALMESEVFAEGSANSGINTNSNFGVMRKPWSWHVLLNHQQQQQQHYHIISP